MFCCSNMNRSYLFGIYSLYRLLKEAKVDAGHGFNHMRIVAEHVRNALKYVSIDDNLKMEVELAAWLHDADDDKFFKTRDYENARKILIDATFPKDSIERIIKMISLVSSRTNGNTVDPNLPFWYYYPRFADRLEATGWVGLLRTYSFTKHKGRNLFDSGDPRVTSYEELLPHIPPQRFIDYQNGKATTTMIGHILDKLLFLKVETNNHYFDNEFAVREKILQDYVYNFGRTGTIDEEELKEGVASLSKITEPYPLFNFKDGEMIGFYLRFEDPRPGYKLCIDKARNWWDIRSFSPNFWARLGNDDQVTVVETCDSIEEEREKVIAFAAMIIKS